MKITGFQDDFDEDNLFKHRGEKASMFFGKAWVNSHMGKDNAQLIADLMEMFPPEPVIPLPFCHPMHTIDRAKCPICGRLN